MWWRVGRKRTILGAAWRQLRKISAKASRCGGGDWAGGGLQSKVQQEEEDLNFLMLKDTTEVIEIQVSKDNEDKSCIATGNQCLSQVSENVCRIQS